MWWILARFFSLAVLGTGAPAPVELPVVVSTGGVERLARWISLGERPHGVARRTDSRPRLGNDNLPMEVGKEEVLIGVLTLEGILPQNMQGEINYCVKRALATITGVPPNQIALSVTLEFSDAHSRDVVNWHFIILPVKGKGHETATAITQAGVADGAIAAFLVALSLEMRDRDALANYYVLALQYAIRVNTPTVEKLEIWRNKDYGVVASTPAPTPAPAPVQQGPPAPAVDPAVCLKTYTPCACAEVSHCAWITDRNSGISSCASNTYGSSGVPCTACSAQARCENDGCLELSDACSCASSKYNCRWDTLASSCTKGSGTSCVACPQQLQCNSAVPKIVTYMPLSGTYMKPTEVNSIRVGFDREIYFIDGSAGGSTRFLCDGSMLPIEISRPRMKILVNYLVLEITGLIGQGSRTNDARSCSLAIDQGLVSDKYGVPFLGLRAGKYRIDFGDTVAPQVLAFSPRNGQTGVAPTAVVTLTFSEKIMLASGAQNLKLEVSRIEEGDSLAKVAELELKSPAVRVDNERLQVDLVGRIEAGFQYTLSLPGGAVADLEQNTFSGLAPRAYVFKTVPKVTSLRTGSSETGVRLSSLIAVAVGLILVLGLAILTVWWFARLKSARNKFLLQQQQGGKNSGGRPTLFVDTTGRMGSLRSGNADRMGHASSETIGASGTAEDFFKPPMRRSETWAPGRTPELSQKRRASTPEPSVSTNGPSIASVHQNLIHGHRASERSGDAQRGGSKERSQSEGARASSKDAFVKSVKPDAARQWQQHTDAKKRWHSAFAQAAAKRAAAPQPGMSWNGKPSNGAPAAPPRRNSSKSASTAPDPFADPDDNGPRTSGEAWRDAAAGMPEAESSTESRGPGRSKTSTASTATSGSPEKDEASPKKASKVDPGTPGSSETRKPSRDATRRSSSDITAPSTSDNPELRRQKEEVERRMRALMDSPIAERKKVLRELMLEYHPDKNHDQHAKDIFQFINASRGWFLCES